MNNKTYNELKAELQANYAMVSPFHYWIISSPLIYPSVCVYNDESTRVFDKASTDDIDRLNDINFEGCVVYQCDGRGKTDVAQGYKLSEIVPIEEMDKKTYKVKFVFDCSNYGSIHRRITCSPDNFTRALSHEIILARRELNLSWDEPSILISKEEV